MLTISDDTSSKDKSDATIISRVRDVFSNDYFYDSYDESIENSDNDET